MSYSTHKLLFEAMEPIHVGAGGYRLGRVDMTIAREPGTNLPKIPGTSLAGAARAYAALRYGRPEAGGQHLKYKPDPAKPCPILYTFGTVLAGEQGQAGRVSFGDARIVLFPVATMTGPVWVTTAEMLKEIGVTVRAPASREQIVTNFEAKQGLNLGWLLFRDVQYAKETTGCPVARVAVVDWSLYPQVVNSNLEVRTSVSINPETRAAQKGQLFSYEAIPRATWLMNEVVKDSYGAKFSSWPVATDADGVKLEPAWESPLDVAKAGLELMKTLGVGGMGTRGFGRLRLVKEVK